MKVYVLLAGDYGDAVWVAGVFQDEDMAIKYREDHPLTGKWDFYYCQIYECEVMEIGDQK